MKALCALRRLVKLQVLVRCHLMRRQASHTLRCMQALVAAQNRAQAARLRLLNLGGDDRPSRTAQIRPTRRSPHHPRSRHHHYQVRGGVPPLLSCQYNREIKQTTAS